MRTNCLKQVSEGNVKSLFYFCVWSGAGYEKSNRRKERNFVVLSFAAYWS